MKSAAAQPKDRSNASETRLAVVMPLANEEKTVEDLLSRVLDRLETTDCVYCILDNVSTDGTLERVRCLGETDKRIIAVWAPENRCVVDAYFCGYREALESSAKWILEMDGGASHQPEEIPKFIEAMESGYDFAAGSRFVKSGSHRGSIWRYLVSRGGSILTNLLLGTKMKDMASGFECFTCEALRYVVEQGVKSRAHFFQTEIRSMLHDWKWIEIPITYRNPSSNIGSENITEALKILWSLSRKPRSTTPQTTPNETVGVKLGAKPDAVKKVS